jgi:hypothetical protein
MTGLLLLSILSPFFSPSMGNNMMHVVPSHVSCVVNTETEKAVWYFSVDGMEEAVFISRVPVPKGIGIVIISRPMSWKDDGIDGDGMTIYEVMDVFVPYRPDVQVRKDPSVFKSVL